MTDHTLRDPTEAAASAARPRLALVLVHHPNPTLSGRYWWPPRLDGAVIGRGRDDLGRGALDDPRLSRRHAALTWRSRQLTVTDLDSTNGTRVGGERISESALEEGDILGAGGALWLVRRTLPLRAATEGPPGLVGVSASIAEVDRQIALVAPRDTTVLLRGETGTGKEVVARAIHAASGRRGAFVAVNCGAVGDDVLASELFGHTRGAFTGADRRRSGLIEAAAGGTLLLDEIGDASPRLQVALLRLLQERRYRPVGADRERTADCRIIAATHRALTGDGFRDDLRNRLARWEILLAPLRERPEDITLLLRRFLGHHIDEESGLTAVTVRGLLEHRWPGNVRELDALVERMAVAWPGEGPVGLPRGWPPQQPAPQQPAPQQVAPQQPAAASRRAQPRRSRPERAELEALLADNGGNMKALAEQLGVSRNTVYRWCSALGVDPREVRQG